MFACGNVLDPLKRYYCKDCVEKFVEHIKNEVKWLCVTFPQQPMAELTDALKREHEAVKNCHICFKEFNDSENRKVRDHCHYTGLYQDTVYNNYNLKYRIPDLISIVFHNLSDYDAYIFMKKMEV